MSCFYSQPAPKQQALAKMVIQTATGRALFTAAGVALAACMMITPTLHAQTPHGAHKGGTAAARDANTRGANAESVALLADLGSWHRRIGTDAPLAQRYFDQGLRLYYAFNHAEAARAFREAQRLDPACVMCYWGEAIALGPNINAPMDPAAERQAISATERGLAAMRSTKENAAYTPAARSREAAFMQAIAARYVGAASSTRADRDSAYATAMAAIADENPRDADAQALAAEAAMDLSPWTYWDKDGNARAGTQRLLAWLERGMKVSSAHPGACHFYIHAVEAAQPERAIPCAEKLAALMPGAGHLVHMPAHIYIRTGRWADAIRTNQHATSADEHYFDGPHTADDAFYSAAYESHNFHFLTFAAVMAGASATALEASEHVVQIVTPQVARTSPSLESLLATPVQTLVAFGRWEEVLRKPLPPADLRVAMAHFWYARGVAFAATSRIAEARATVDSIRSVARTLPAGEAQTTMQIAARMVEGEVSLQNGDAATAVSAFTEAAALEDGLGYMEPPTWYRPVRYSLGKALLAAGRAQEAEQAYLADLRRFPENGWALNGLVQALNAQGLKREARAVSKRLANSWRMADVKLTGVKL